MSERTDQQEKSEVENTDEQTSEALATPSKLISKERMREYLQFSWRNVVGIWMCTAVISACILLLVDYTFGDAMLVFFYSILAIGLGFIGTIITYVPSIFSDIGENELIKDAMRFNRKVWSAHEQLKEGKTLSEGSEGFEEMSAQIYECTDFTDEINSITPIVDKWPHWSYDLKINGETENITSKMIAFDMKMYERDIERGKEHHQEIQERRQVVLGGGIYSIAILIQAIGTIITKLPI